jgi:hypothetical protein
MLVLEQWNSASEEEKKALIDKYSRLSNLRYDQIKRLENSPALVHRFFQEAHKVAEKRNHYSARTIIEFLRHSSALEDGDVTFKINDHIAAPLARISMEMFPRLNNFFEIRNPTFKLEMQ